jgi:hypothetical protein
MSFIQAPVNAPADSGSSTVFKRTRSDGFMDATGAQYQTGSGQAVQINSASHMMAILVVPPIDFLFSGVAAYLAAEATQGNSDWDLVAYDAANGVPDESTKIQDLFTLDSGGAGAAWLSDAVDTPYQWQRNKPLCILATGEAAKDFSFSTRRVTDTHGTEFCSWFVKTWTSTDGGSTWTEATQDARSAMWNIILNPSTHNSPQLWAGRYNGQYVPLPDGTLLTIPETGVGSGDDVEALTANKIYDVYWYASSGTTLDKLEFVDPAVTAKTSTNGIEHKTGAATHPYLGQIVPVQCQSGYQGPINTNDKRYVWNAHNSSSIPWGKRCPYYTTSYDTIAASTLQRVHTDAYKCSVLVGKRARLRATFSSYGNSNNVSGGFGVDQYAAFEDTSGVSAYYITATLDKMVPPGLHNIWPLAQNVYGAGSYNIYSYLGSAPQTILSVSGEAVI